MRRTAAEVLGILRKSGLRIFRTGDIALLTSLDGPAMVKALSRLAAQELVVKVRRGIWASRLVGDLNPYEMVPHLTAPWPSYVSLHSILSDEGVVEEVPHVVYAVTSGRPAVYRTPLGQVHVHHLPPRFIWGYSMRSSGRGAYPVADREKAFLDLVYLALSRRSPLQFPHKRGRAWRLDREKIREYAKRFGFPPMFRYLKNIGLY
jgi:predicted transcriptional regulator of viral defense system